MAFSDLFGQNTQTTQPSGGGWSPLFSKVPRGTVNVQALNQSVQEAQQAATQANSFGGLVKNTFTLGGQLTPSNIIGGAKELGSDIFKAATQPLEPSSYNPSVAVKTNPLEVPKTAWDTVKTAISDAGNRLADTYQSVPAAIEGKGSKLQAAVDVGEAGMGALNALFSPVSGALQGLAKVPVVGVAAGALNNLFGALGAGGGTAAEGLVDALPVSDATKQKVMPLAQEAGALAAQIAAGKAGSDALGLLKDKTSQIVDHVQEDVSKAQPIEQTQGQQPLTAGIPKEIVSTQVAKEVAATPIAQTAPIKSADLPPNSPLRQVLPTEDTQTVQSVATETQKAEPTTVKVPKTQLPVGEGEAKVSRLEARVTQNLEDLSPDKIEQLGLSTYNQMNKADQIKAATEYVTENPEDALKVLQGTKEPPKGLLKNSLYVAMDNLAMDDAGLARKLASLSSTRYGQEISILTEVNPDSPVSAIKKVEQARVEGLKGRGIDVAKETTKIAKEVKESVRKAVSPRPAWEDFIKEIQCNY